MNWLIWSTVGLLAVLVVVLVVMRWIASPRETLHDRELLGGQHKRLVVMAHGLTGYKLFEPAVRTAQQALPASDFLVFNYDARLLSNASPYAVANRMERSINEVVTANGYDEIVLIGHSMGGMLLRKVLLWANGIEQDRTGTAGLRPWSAKVSRFVSLATINRGWSLDPKPDQMGIGRYIAGVIGQRLARWSGSGGLLLAMQRGAPFVADARVQWIDLSRGNAPTGARLPLTIHLLGDEDDVVSRQDAADIGVAHDTVFVTLPETDHAAIALALQGNTAGAGEERYRKVVAAMQGRLDLLDQDQSQSIEVDPTIRRLVYVMHGIRDYGEWSDKLREQIQQEGDRSGADVAVVSAKYGHFPMAPFLLYWDRQKNVRWFMDEFTQSKARFPKLETVDFVGHSNGTYILASSLQRYKSLSIGRVYFAGSVVRQAYPWRELVNSRRVGEVVNIVASRDWVVAFFPRLFEQLAEWVGSTRMDGLLDIGSAGFRGFRASQDPNKRVENFQFALGGHDVGIAPKDNNRAVAISQAIAKYVVNGEKDAFKLFLERQRPQPIVDVLSNISWFVWIFAAVTLSGIGFGVYCLWGPWASAAFAIFVIGLLYSV